VAIYRKTRKGVRDVVDKRDKVLRDVRQASLCELRPDRSNYKFQEEKGSDLNC